ncbi:GNAT family N-acetyltransferase [bacterium]|nr:GNAT family N-acetyltransferase [bacterium]
MIKFVKIKIDRKKRLYRNISFLEEIYFLYKRFSRYLNDDFAREDLLEEIICAIEINNPYFWVILSNDDFAGFVLLENMIGNSEKIYSAEITTCFKSQFWGDFTKKAAKKFIRYCFKKLGIKKLKAKIYKENVRSAAILRAAGMTFEAELKAETMKNGKPQDIMVYSVIKR